MRGDASELAHQLHGSDGAQTKEEDRGSRAAARTAPSDLPVQWAESRSHLDKDTSWEVSTTSLRTKMPNADSLSEEHEPRRGGYANSEHRSLLQGP